ncbi:MAG: phosphoenolpyruvate--protein phosphotransferase [Eubacterium sp.]|nr:phosphoenolpyruvate--protein phosphotransferase [Eubacterium sp.]
MLNGIGCSNGYAIGKAEVIKGEPVISHQKGRTDPEKELSKYIAAVRLFEQRIKELSERLDGEDKDILIWQTYILKDPYMDAEINRQIMSGHSAERAIIAACEMYSKVLMMSPSELIRQRTADIDDVRNTMLELMSNEKTPVQWSENVVLIADTLTPSMTLGLDKKHVCAVAAETGGITSHPAILARSMGIPAVLSVEGITDIISSGDTVIVDGTNGSIIPAPDEKTIEEYQAKIEEYRRRQQAMAEYAAKPTVTASGEKIVLYANIVDPEEAEQAKALGCDGIGLFRTEFMFMDRQFPPGENEQLAIYKKAALIMGDRPVIIRTLDIGADKIPPCLETNGRLDPHSDVRGIRYSLKNIELFKVQLRALMRASAFGYIRILLPMIDTPDEIREVRKIIRDIGEDFKNRGIDFNENITVGAMAETPAACLTADLIAAEADFISIGTNDLTQFIMAANREEKEMRKLCRASQPAVQRAIAHIIKTADAAGKPVGICGEAAANLSLLPGFLEYGAKRFSVSLSSVLDVRKTISEI